MTQRPITQKNERTYYQVSNLFIYIKTITIKLLVKPENDMDGQYSHTLQHRRNFSTINCIHAATFT